MSGDPSHRLFAIFQGGGAKGFAHLGALKALEELRVGFLGVAGTSSGAIIAALLSVGYTPDEIYDPKSPDENILSPWGGTVPSLLGEPEWKRFLALRSSFSALRSSFRTMRRAGLPSRFLHVLRILWHLRDGGVFAAGGLLSARRIIEVLDELLRTRLVLNYEADGSPASAFDGAVRFKHVNPTVPGCLSLKVIATDFKRNREVVFSAEDTPEVSIAEAVVASAAYPFVFRPVSVAGLAENGTASYIDGGLASNFPVWIFQEEKLALERLIPGPLKTVGFAFEAESAPEQSRFDLLEYCLRLIECSLSAGQALQLHSLEDLEVIELPCDLEVTEFDPPIERLNAAYSSARLKTYAYLDGVLNRRPKNISELLRRVRSMALAELGLGESVRLRVSAIAPVRVRYRRADPLHFRVIETAGFDEDDTDDRLLLDVANTAAPRAFRDKRPVIWPVESGSRESGGWGLEPMTKYERALVRPTLRCILALPVFRATDDWRNPASKPLGVIAVDSDEDLRGHFRRDTFLNLMSLETAGLGEVFEET